RHLRDAYDEVVTLLEGAEEWGEEHVDVALAALAHSAYHLGAVRQFLTVLRARAETSEEQTPTRRAAPPVSGTRRSCDRSRTPGARRATAPLGPGRGARRPVPRPRAPPRRRRGPRARRTAR